MAPLPDSYVTGYVQNTSGKELQLPTNTGATFVLDPDEIFYAGDVNKYDFYQDLIFKRILSETTEPTDLTNIYIENNKFEVTSITTGSLPTEDGFEGEIRILIGDPHPTRIYVFYNHVWTYFTEAPA